jgi:hypothetical protein
LGCGDAIAKRDLGIAFWGCGECDSEALLQAVRFLGFGSVIAFGVWGVRSLFGYVGMSDRV